jgi:hypothetical protein
MLRRMQIEMQMAPGTFYAAMIADGTGLWGAGTSEVLSRAVWASTQRATTCRGRIAKAATRVTRTPA